MNEPRFTVEQDRTISVLEKRIQHLKQARQTLDDTIAELSVVLTRSKDERTRDRIRSAEYLRLIGDCGT